MKNIINRIYQNQSIIYKIFLFVMVVFSIVYFFPKGGKFKYEFQKGKPWQYETLLAPFDFSIQKTDDEISIEKQEIIGESNVYFEYKEEVKLTVQQKFSEVYDKIINEKGFQEVVESAIYKKTAKDLIEYIYKRGFVDTSVKDILSDNKVVLLRKQQEVSEIQYGKFITPNEILPLINSSLRNQIDHTYKSIITNVLTEVLVPNVFFDQKYTDKDLQELLNTISYTKGKVSTKELIIVRGDIVEGKKLEVLNSLKAEYTSQIWTKKNYVWILTGYIILVSLAMGMLMLFLYLDRKEIFENNTHVTFIFLNVLLMVFLETFIIKHMSEYLYVVPICILPIVMKAFFDARVALFSYLLMVLMLGFVVPNSFEYIYLQTIAGFVTILTVSDLHKRGNLFISVIKITLVYMLTYLAFYIIHEGGVSQIRSSYFGLFALNGVLSFLSVFLIWLYEKLFGLVSDITLLELSSTNSLLLRDLNEKAPGTFQHSMQVANLAEAAANEINANVMLVRTGALYHDIGKMLDPFYFTENQSTSVNPHNELSPKDSAKIIIGHVIEGIELAKKHRLPDRIIDFIRTHHGTSLVYYFYKKEQDANPDVKVNLDDFRYPGPIPFSKETSILMMCDAAEAASKSLSEPSATAIDELIERIIEKQKSEGQFLNANITLKEIESVKKVIKKKLKNIYHLRIEYPE
ncbi:HD family phosphohydrolase [Wenyingzhuangia sp. 2_MG-2023]|uniref:HD family phosphohydrolase n=1 Tax=Wenyingzhuangia sp. 2_MG-2023 TaxID=3062639 RepID=UPI0026E2CEB6|nr:HDIG domain-containing metalloprotein [Wenyingzhuangia sp. 2_MG-2023]MDO6739279.1 HDIG domain-containing protein [Wenyingzhuangia sp. 2_MG-2023]